MPLSDTAIRHAKPTEKAKKMFREWFAKHSPNWSGNHGNRIIRRLERDIFPWVGGKSIANITAPKMLEVIRRIEKRVALESAHRALGNCGQVFRYAVATGRAYNRTAHLPERRKMMQEWADYLDKLKAGAEIISNNQRA